MYQVIITYYSDRSNKTSVEGNYDTQEEAERAASFYNMGADYSNASVKRI